MHAGDGYERMTDHALNVLYVLGFISMGEMPTVKPEDFWACVDCQMIQQ
jgi:hypothetical protein